MEVSELINIILWNKRYVKIPDYISTPSEIDRYIMLKLPTITDKNHYLHFKKMLIEEAIDNNVPSEKELLKNSGWTEEDQEILEKYEDHIDYLQKHLEKNKKFLSIANRVKKEIAKTQSIFDDTNKRYNSIIINSAEYYANEIAIIELLRRVAIKEDEELLWKTEEELELVKKEYHPLINFLAIDMMQEGVLPIVDIRAVARSGEWRIIWSSSRENLSDLFDRPISDLGVNQKLLTYWSKVYDTIYEDPDKPEEDIINDDEACDEWLLNRSLSREEDKDNANRPNSNISHANDHHERLQVLDGYFEEQCICGAIKVKSKGLGEKAPHASDCEYGVYKRYTEEEKERAAKRIYGRNNSRVRQLINAEHDVISKSGSIEEQKLRNKVNRTILGAESKTVDKK
jgi:hypothetical protein